MRTTINLPNELVEKALKASRCKTKTALFKMALHSIILREEIAAIKDYRGKLDLDIDLDDLRQRKNDFSR